MDNRKFCGSISVRVGTERVKIELSPAPLHGGPEGFYRVRVARRWLDHDAAPRFLDREGIARIAAETALCGLEAPGPAPDIPANARVSVWAWIDDMPQCYGTWTKTPPILAYTGEWVVAVIDMNGKTAFVPCRDVTVHRRFGHGK